MKKRKLSKENIKDLMGRVLPIKEARDKYFEGSFISISDEEEYLYVGVEDRGYITYEVSEDGDVSSKIHDCIEEDKDAFEYMSGIILKFLEELESFPFPIMQVKIESTAVNLDRIVVDDCKEGLIIIYR